MPPTHTMTVFLLLLVATASHLLLLPVSAAAGSPDGQVRLVDATGKEVLHASGGGIAGFLQVHDAERWGFVHAGK